MSAKIFRLISIILVAVLLSSCQNNADMPNPASVFCEENDGKLEIRTNEDGSQVGYCLFEDGSECEEWAFYRGECQPGDSLTPNADMPNPAAVFCEENGGIVEIRTSEDGSQVGYCLFEDGSECDEWAFYRGECKPGDSLTPNADMPNPASAYCEDNQGTLQIVTDEYGSQIGLCQFEDGSVCEEWAYYRNECQIGGAYALSGTDDAGWQIYENEDLGYRLHIPESATVTSQGDPNMTITIQGQLEDDEYWPVIFFNHPTNRPEYTLPDGAALEDWLEQNELLVGERQDDITIAGESAIHLRQNTSEQAYPSDLFYFAKTGQIFSIVILHTNNQEDWALYEQFLNAIEFD